MFVVQIDRRSFRRPQQVGLGQRWPLVRQLGLGADEDDPSREALIAEDLGCGRTGQAGADDDVGFFAVHDKLPGESGDGGRL
jgi:hypothetical protein